MMKISRWFAVILAALEPFLRHHSIAAETLHREYEPPPKDVAPIIEPQQTFGTAFISMPRFRVSAVGAVSPKT